MIISYAQNFEDVMLLRALKQVEKGFYIDVGANDPSIDWVTKAFYQRDWNGINIEPLSVHFLDLQQERPRDINLHTAVGAFIGEIEIWECDVRGWATADKAIIEKHSDMGHIGRYSRVPMSTLTAICERNAPQEIHFLKIDVEGFERPVLEGMNFQRFRPWIVVVEAISPNSTDKVHDQWENLLTASSYFFVYADGINRFYLAREHEDLMAAFEYPPNFSTASSRLRKLRQRIELTKLKPILPMPKPVPLKPKYALPMPKPVPLRPKPAPPMPKPVPLRLMLAPPMPKPAPLKPKHALPMPKPAPLKPKHALPMPKPVPIKPKPLLPN